jgi:type IV secretory pathway ATPase VirB11/archaellum biosynthesis ATPase
LDTLVANTLSSVLFSDIFLSSDEADPILVLNLSGEGIRPTKSRGPMVLPDVYRSDARSLFRATEQKWSAERFAPEFNLVYDSLAYRCSQIAAPESAVQIPRESSLSQTRRNWCLRRVDAGRISLDQLGYPAWAREELRRIGASSGLLLVSGSFGSGKSTTSAACFKDWITLHGGVGVTLEDPPEKALEGFYDSGQIYQISVRDSAFGEAIKASRRWAYRYLYLGEVRDQGSAAELLQIALGGPMVITTIHASAPVEALMALSKFAAGASDPRSVNDRIAASIIGVIWQSLRGGIVDVQYLSFRGRNADSMRTKISEGRFRLLKEDLAYQANLRSLGRIEESF